MASTGEFQGINQYWPKRTQKARLTFAKKHLDDPADFWENILWTDETRVERFGRRASHYIWSTINTAIQKKNIIAPVKHGDSGVMI